MAVADRGMPRGQQAHAVLTIPRPALQVRGNNPEEWLACASKLDALKAKQAKGRGNGGPSTPNASTIRQQQNGSVGLASTYRTVTDDRRLFIDSDQTVTVSLPDGNVRMLEVPGGRSTAKGDCLVTVKTYSIASDYQQSTPATSYWGRPRPFYKDYRHYSRLTSPSPRTASSSLPFAPISFLVSPLPLLSSFPSPPLSSPGFPRFPPPSFVCPLQNTNVSWCP